MATTRTVGVDPQDVDNPTGPTARGTGRPAFFVPVSTAPLRPHPLHYQDEPSGASKRLGNGWIFARVRKRKAGLENSAHSTNY
jgi:hypothetical protein